VPSSQALHAICRRGISPSKLHVGAHELLCMTDALLRSSSLATVSSGASRRETSLNLLEISRRAWKGPVSVPGPWMSVWHSICSPGAAGLLGLLRVSGRSFRCGQQLIRSFRCDGSKRIKEVAERHGFRGIIAGAMQDNA
jgi:hypothetical protein